MAAMCAISELACPARIREIEERCGQEEIGRDFCCLSYQLIMPQPDADIGEFDEGQVVRCLFLVSCGDGTEMLERR